MDPAIADLVRKTFDGRLSYVGPDCPRIHGQPYNFDLVGPAYLATQAARGPEPKPTRTWRSGPDRAAGNDD